MSTDPRNPRRETLGAALVHGALLALVIAYAGSYVAVRCGYGVVGASGTRVTGPSVFARAALNLYAIQHVTLIGAGRVVDALGNQERVSAKITLPLTIWAAIPILALLLGGYTAARPRCHSGRRYDCHSQRGGERSDSHSERGEESQPGFFAALRMTGSPRGPMIASGLGAGFLYAVALMVAGDCAGSRIDVFLLPEIGGISSNPPPIPLEPMPGGLWVLAFGIVFGGLGALIALRGVGGERGPGKWWACAKGALIVALVVQTLIAASSLAWSLTRKHGEGDQPRIIEMLPAAAGIGYSMVHGSTLLAGVESKIASVDRVERPFHARVSLYGGVTQGHSHKPVAAYVWGIALAIGIVAAALMGRLAARWGSSDGPLRTGLRVAVIHTIYLAAVSGLCAMGLTQSGAFATSAIVVKPLIGWTLALSFAGVFALSALGARHAAREL